MKILIVEDDSFLISAYKVKFTKEGFDVSVASNGEEALELLKTISPEVIVLDLIMPKMDGFATLEALKKDPALAGIPVIIASNLGQSEDIEKGKNMGAVDFIIKSDMSLDELVEKVRKFGKSGSVKTA